MRQDLLIALGSNEETETDSPRGIVAQAIRRLASRGLRIHAVSRFFRTPCFPAGAGADYANACILADVDHLGLDARGTLALLHEVEAEFGRKRVQRWGSRTLDLDLLAMGDVVLPDLAGFNLWRDLPLEQQIGATPDRLILPHPRIQDRAFVLVPLCDVAPDWPHPMLNRTARQLRDQLKPEEIAEIRPL